MIVVFGCFDCKFFRLECIKEFVVFMVLFIVVRYLCGFIVDMLWICGEVKKVG